MSSVKLNSVISKFDGNEDFAEWVRKVELVASLQEISDLEKFVPLFLIDGAFAVYERLEEHVKKDYMKLKGALISAFSLSRYQAFEEFSSRKLRGGEPVDIYVADIRRLSSLISPSTPEEWLVSKVVSGLPDEMRKQLLAAFPLEGKSLNEVVERVRVLASTNNESVSAVARERPAQRIVRCFRCNTPGHISRECQRKDMRRCFVCGKAGHLAATCEHTSLVREGKKRGRRIALSCAGGLPGQLAQLPMIDVWVEGRKCRGLLDTGCSRSILSSRLGEMFSKRCVAARGVVMMNGAEQPCEQIFGVNMEMQGAKISLNCLVSRILPGVDVLIGVDAVHALGGVKIDGEGRVAMMRGRTVDVAALVKDCSSKELTITDQDFLAVFKDGAWTVTWKWKDDVPPNLKNRVAEYEIRTDIKEAYEKELQTWIEEGWLQPFRGEAKGLVPLMAVEQKQKKKVRPVLDFREINQFIKCHTADSEVCTDRLREWRRKSSRAVLLDLRKAYLQLRVDASLWSFQTVRFKGEMYALTRLGFGLSVAPRIMVAVVNRVLSEDPEVQIGEVRLLLLITSWSMKTSSVMRQLWSCYTVLVFR